MEYEEYVVDLNADCPCGCMDNGRFHKIFHFPNDWGVSVVDAPKKPGYTSYGYCALIITFSDPMTYKVIRNPPFTPEQLNCRNWAAVVEILDAVKALDPVSSS